MTEAQVIADGLSEAQRRAVLDAEPIWPHEEELFLPMRIYREKGMLVQTLHAAGLVTIVMRGVMLNERGLSVREILEARHD